MTLRGPMLAVLVATGLQVAVAGQGPALTVSIVDPTGDTFLVGQTAITADVRTDGTPTHTVAFFVDGRLICTRTAPPWQCSFDAGSVPRQRHLRVVARHIGGERAVANLRTREPGFVDAAHITAIQVPVIVRDGRGRVMRNLGAEHFVLTEDGVVQDISAVSEADTSLDAVLALDISASMADVMTDVVGAADRFLDQLRPLDTATVLAFNENTFVVMDRETDVGRRRLAATDLTPWGGTALHDATAEALALADRGTGRKGVVVFTDGEDRASRANSTTTIRRIQESDVLVYTIAFGLGVSDPAMRRQLEAYASSSGGQVFFAKGVEALNAAFTEILTELTGHYVLSYIPRHTASGWRRLEVRVRHPGAKVRARAGYLSAP